MSIKTKWAVGDFFTMRTGNAPPIPEQTKKENGYFVCEVTGVGKEVVQYTRLNSSSGGSIWSDFGCEKITEEEALGIVFNRTGTHECTYQKGSNEPCETCPRKISTLYMCKLLQEE